MDASRSLVKKARRSATRGGLGLGLLLLLGLSLAPAFAVGLAGCGDADGGDLLGPEPEPRPPEPSLRDDGSGGGKVVDGADITGRIVTASAAGAPADDADPVLGFLIEDGVGEVDRASVTATAATQWYRIESAAIVGLDAAPGPGELSGRRVAVAFYGPVAESYPVQATAGWVVLLD